MHCGDIGLCGPSVPVRGKSGVCLRLAEFMDAIEFRCCTAAAHTSPLVVGHPRLDDELRPEIDASDWQGSGKGALGIFMGLMLHGGSLMRMLTMSSRHPGSREDSIGDNRENETFHT